MGLKPLCKTLQSRLSAGKQIAEIRKTGDARFRGVIYINGCDFESFWSLCVARASIWAFWGRISGQKVTTGTPLETRGKLGFGYSLIAGQPGSIRRNRADFREKFETLDRRARYGTTLRCRWIIAKRWGLIETMAGALLIPHPRG